MTERAFMLELGPLIDGYPPNFPATIVRWTLLMQLIGKKK